MSELVPAPFSDLVKRLFLEPPTQGTLFDLPRRSWFEPSADGPDMGVSFHGFHAGNPVGPASGPHTQMAQNLVLSYIAGSRIMELKTVQVNDRLDIPRPCIDMTNVGYNIEWSQELLVEQSLHEYVAGMMLVEMFRRVHPEAAESLRGPAGDVIYDISLGYDLEGIKSAKVQKYLDGIRDASDLIERFRALIPAKFAKARELDYPRCISTTLTLSTFHGCPTDEIERICEFLIAERDLDVIVKMNPPTLGKEELEHLLNDVMGYTEITVRPEAYTSSQTFEEAVDMARRLEAFARQRGRRFGCKFSNTLEVLNHREFFPPGNDVMYLSGAPLHVITMALAARFREAIGPHLPISFSAGIDAENFPSAVASGFVPVTTCSDLLKTGGYGRLPAYLTNLAKAMSATGASTVDEYILKAYDQEAEARKRAGDGASPEDVVRWASVLNNRIAADEARDNPRYGAEKNRREPKRIDSRLVLFDCITCDKCIPVCPNDANFTYPLAEADFEYEDIEVFADGTTRGTGKKQFKIAKKHQIANYGEFCNECGNCDTFCPEYGGPYIEKPTLHGSRQSYEEAAPRDGFHIDTSNSGASIRGRIRGIEHCVEFQESEGVYLYTDGTVEARFAADDDRLLSARLLNGASSATLDVGLYHSIRHLWRGILDESRINQINVALV